MSSLNPSLTRWQGIGLMATTLLGTGVFILPQLTIASAGRSAVLTWVLLTLAILPIAWVFAELGRRFPSAAGPAFFVQEAFGRRYGYVIGLMFFFVVPMGAPAALMITFEFLKPIIQLSPLQSIMGQLVTLGLLFAMNWHGLRLSGRAQLLLTLAIVVVVVLLLSAYLWQHPSPKTPIATGSSFGVLQAMGLALWSFLGIEAITHLSAEFKDPKRDFVPAVLGGTVLVGLIYVACTLLSLLDVNAPLAIVASYKLLLGHDGRWLIAVLGIASGLATVNVYMASVARLAWSLSQEGVLPSFIKPLNRHQVPSRALLLVLFMCSATMLVAYAMGENYEAMVRWTNGVFIFIYIASMLAAWRLLGKRYQLAIFLSLIVCSGFVVSLGTSLGYGVLLALVLSVWVHWRKPKPLTA
ncbi:L-methionine/branched-chain amino acid transporter [Thiolinea disciformis]|uniref:L-methionine/branched-chain amino acid transporter n=1 Tax=Thiolinea disciformis TaxID=125614 RepID=UPI0003620AEC|nr:L-methionine/branched-chain amino acid transporter [Thiolinea disciformis]